MRNELLLYFEIHELGVVRGLSTRMKELVEDPAGKNWHLISYMKLMQFDKALIDWYEHQLSQNTLKMSYVQLL